MPLSLFPLFSVLPILPLYLRKKVIENISAFAELEHTWRNTFFFLISITFPYCFIPYNYQFSFFNPVCKEMAGKGFVKMSRQFPALADRIFFSVLQM